MRLAFGYLALRLKKNAPGTIGVPLMIAVRPSVQPVVLQGSRLRPGGRVPPMIVNCTGPVPPTAVIVVENGWPTAPLIGRAAAKAMSMEFSLVTVMTTVFVLI